MNWWRNMKQVFTANSFLVLGVLVLHEICPVVVVVTFILWHVRAK